MSVLTYGQTFTLIGASIDPQAWITAMAQAEQMGGELLPGPPKLITLEYSRQGVARPALAWPVVREVRR